MQVIGTDFDGRTDRTRAVETTPFEGAERDTGLVAQPGTNITNEKTHSISPHQYHITQSV
jgi:hypothetical protein